MPWTRSGSYWSSTKEAADTLPAGQYSVVETMTGYTLRRQEVQSDNLERFDGSPADDVINEIALFRKELPKFAEFGLVAKRGILLHGPPGTGKTSTLNIVAERLVEGGDIVLRPPRNPHAIEIILHSIRDQEPDRFVAVIIEDVERMGASADFLNILDGSASSHNTAFLMTTNYITKLPDTLLKRPSRIDTKVLVTPPTEAHRQLYLERLGASEAIARMWASKTEGLSFAQLKEVFVGHYVFGKDPARLAAQFKADGSSITFSEAPGEGLPVFRFDDE